MAPPPQTGQAVSGRVNRSGDSGPAVDIPHLEHSDFGDVQTGTIGY